VSRIGKMPVSLPQGVQAKIEKDTVTISGEKGSLSHVIPSGITVESQGDTLVLLRDSEHKTVRSLHGLTRALIQNMVVGVSKGYEKTLVVEGVGYKAKAEKHGIVFDIGYSHPILFMPPDGISMNVVNPTEVTVSGIDKQLVGQVAAKIRSFRPPAVYTGKGIRYKDEQVRRKAGKGGA